MRLIVLGVGVLAALAAACGGSSDDDRCQGVVCDTPPANVCKDTSVLTEYASPGTCQPGTGECSYSSQDRTCAKGCANGACALEDQVGGFIGVFEKNDAGSWGRWPAVAAHFAVEPNYQRSLPLLFGPPVMTQVAQEGACALYKNPLLLFLICDPACGPDQDCLGDNTCKDFPKHYNAGTLTLEGLKTAAVMTPDAYDVYEFASPPAELFDAGDVVTAKASGGELPAFTMQARGVADLELPTSVVSLEVGMPSTVAWTPADPGSLIRVVLRLGPHDPVRPMVAIVCDGADADGSIEIPASIVDGFLLTGGPPQKDSFIIRYTRQTMATFGKEIEFLVGSARNLQLATP
jgi:hypothetical protein